MRTLAPPNSPLAHERHLFNRVPTGSGPGRRPRLPVRAEERIRRAARLPHAGESPSFLR